VHFGIVLMFVGFTGQSWNKDTEVSLSPGQSQQAGEYSLTYVREHMEVDNTKRGVFASVDVSEGGKYLGRLDPGKLMYKRQPDAPQTVVAISHGLRHDVYVIVGSIDPETKVASLQIHVNPLVSWIWIGCIILILGSVVCMWPQVELGESRVWAGARGAAAVATSVFLGIMLAATPIARAQSMTPGNMDGYVRIDNDDERLLFGKLRCTCPGCQRPLSSCSCGEADAARERIREQMRARLTVDEIVASYVAEHGTDALLVPPNSGVMKAIYAVPVLGIALGGYGLVRMLRRWRRNEGAAQKAAAAKTAPKDAYDARLDDELKELDD
jgi:cytochrome c-type biogenesis protein CcmF